MDGITTIEGDLNARDLRVTIVAARFNEFIVESLIKGAVHCLRQHGAADSAIATLRLRIRRVHERRFRSGSSAWRSDRYGRADDGYDRAGDRTGRHKGRQ